MQEKTAWYMLIYASQTCTTTPWVQGESLRCLAHSKHVSEYNPPPFLCSPPICSRVNNAFFLPAFEPKALPGSILEHSPVKKNQHPFCAEETVFLGRCCPQPLQTTGPSWPSAPTSSSSQVERGHSQFCGILLTSHVWD